MFQNFHCHSANKIPVTTPLKCYREIFISIQGLSETRRLINFGAVSYMFMIILGPIVKRQLLTIATRREI